MDEDQVNEEQGNEPERQEVTFKQAEQEETPSRGMFSAVRSCLLYTSPSPRDTDKSRMPSSA